MGIGTKIYKKDIDWDEYSQTAEWCNENHATIVDKGEYYEVVKIPAPTEAELNAIKVEQLKAELSATDYKCLKYVDGALTEEEYAEVKKYRAILREQINQLEEK